MNLFQWLEFIEQPKSSSLSPEEVFLETATLAKKLEVKLGFKKVIIVGGTNGKGSCVTLLESIYHAAGYRVGAFVSPHLLKFNERIRLNKKMVDDEAIVQALGQVEQERKESGFGVLGYFRYVFLAALLIFKKADLDVLILEVGIGGRLDAVNVIEPDLSIIASIGLDHAEILGNTREQVTREKSGIMRSDKPVVLGDPNPPENMKILIQEYQAIAYQQGQDFQYEEHGEYWNFIYKNKEIKKLIKPKVELLNAATSLMAITCLQSDLPVSQDKIQQGLRETFIPGRMQWLRVKNRNILLDVSHNVNAVQLLARTLIQSKSHGRIYAVLGMMKDKDISGVVHELIDIVNTWVLVDLPISRSALSDQLKAILLQQHVASQKIQCYTTPISGFKAALEQAKPDDSVIVFGSFRTVESVMSYLQ